MVPRDYKSSKGVVRINGRIRSVVFLNLLGETTLLDLPQKSTSIHIQVAAASYDAVGKHLDGD